MCGPRGAYIPEGTTLELQIPRLPSSGRTASSLARETNNRQTLLLSLLVSLSSCYVCIITIIIIIIITIIINETVRSAKRRQRARHAPRSIHHPSSSTVSSIASGPKGLCNMQKSMIIYIVCVSLSLSLYIHIYIYICTHH